MLILSSCSLATQRRLQIADLVQQSNLALNICETIINLHRTYFAKALYDTKDDMVGSPYMPSFLTVIERCAVRQQSSVR